jgi:hypothetical protein
MVRSRWKGGGRGMDGRNEQEKKGKRKKTKVGGSESLYTRCTTKVR